MPWYSISNQELNMNLPSWPCIWKHKQKQSKFEVNGVGSANCCIYTRIKNWFPTFICVEEWSTRIVYETRNVILEPEFRAILVSASDHPRSATVVMIQWSTSVSLIMYGVRVTCEILKRVTVFCCRLSF